jgi:hypothetical protein
MQSDTEWLMITDQATMLRGREGRLNLAWMPSDEAE